MSTDTILLFAIGVFVLAGIGIALTVREFERLRKETSGGATQNSGQATD